MDYEKAYNGLVAKIKEALLYAQTDSTKNVLEDILSEPIESEDEKIRKAILQFVKHSNDTAMLTTEQYSKWIEWLEKQKEQKPVEWSEHQHKLLNYAVSLTDDAEVKRFLESLRGKPFFVEWTEEEKKRIDRIIDIIDWAEEKGRLSYSDYLDYCIILKSLRPQPHWKPSEEQMNSLLWIIENANKSVEVNCELNSLYEQLKKL